MGNILRPYNSSYALKDELGEVRPIEVDQHCRNYVFLSKDLCVLPYLNSLLRNKVESLKIIAQYYANDVGVIRDTSLIFPPDQAGNMG